MIRPATAQDIESVEDTYMEHFAYEKNHKAFTVFREGVYPTRQDAEDALRNQALYVFEESGKILGSIILDDCQPEEYAKVQWPSGAAPEQVLVIHLLLIRHSASGRGIGTSLLLYAEEIAKKRSRTVLRLDTGAQNIPATSLYQKEGFQLSGTSCMNVGGAIAHRDHLFFEKILSVTK